MKKKSVKSNKKQELNLSSPDSTFFSSFIGEWVEIICKDAQIDTPTGRLPLAIGGFLMDVDDLHLYTSEDGQQISGAVKRSDYISIQVAKQYSETEAMMDSVSIPEDRNLGN